jgi:hypothetical protein
MTKKEKYGTIGLLGLIVGIGIVINSINQTDLKNNGQYTKGKVVDFHFSNNEYILEYEYTVEGEVYSSKTSIHYFECPNGVPGCLGNEYTVFYSSKNPWNSRIDLGEYDKLKPFTPVIVLE